LLTRGERLQFDARQAETVSVANTAVTPNHLFSVPAAFKAGSAVLGELWGKRPISAILKCVSQARACVSAVK
jgi:hypothetical protein